MADHDDDTPTAKTAVILHDVSEGKGHARFYASMTYHGNTMAIRRVIEEALAKAGYRPSRRKQSRR